MPRHDKCDHYRCDGGPCKQLTDAEVTPGPDDHALARTLIMDGWLLVSHPYHHIARLTEEWPAVEMLVHPRWFDKPEIWKRIEKLWSGEARFALRMLASGPPSEYVETRTLTLKQFRAFKSLGGQSA